MPYKSGKKWIAQVRINDKKQRKIFEKKADAKAWEVMHRELATEEPQEETIDTASLFNRAAKYLDFSEIKFSGKTYAEKKSPFQTILQNGQSGSPSGVLESGTGSFLFAGTGRQTVWMFSQ